MTGTMVRLLFEREIDVGQRLRLDPLRGVDHQDRAFAGGQRARHLVVKVDVAGRVDEVELVGLAVGGQVRELHRRRLDGDPALALEIHAVHELRLALAVGERVGGVQDPVGQRRLSVVDVGDDREIANQARRRGHWGGGRRRSASGRKGRAV